MAKQSMRTENGGRIDRQKTLRFTFDGKTYHGHPGDTLASALLANGVHLMGRSFKYHRPRGVFSAGVEEPSALVHINPDTPRHTPNTRATMQPLYQGLRASSQHNWPSLKLDVGEVNSLFSGLFSAGFYYKTFMWPQKFWPVYEKFIRKAAGLGRSPTVPDPDPYDTRHEHCDVLIAGGGPAGLAAALTAGRAGARVILADEQTEMGGSLLCENANSPVTIDGAAASDWLKATLAELRGMENVQLLPATTVNAYYHDNFLTLWQSRTDHLPPEKAEGCVRQRLWQVRAQRVVLATGAHEKAMVFEGNDRPGVMLAGAARKYLNQYGVKVGRQVVLLTNNDSAYRTALDLADAGVNIAAIVDTRKNPQTELHKQALEKGLPVLENHVVVGATGHLKVKKVDVMALDDAGEKATGDLLSLKADCLLVSGGWTPAVHLFSQSRGKVTFDPDLQSFVPGEAYQAQYSAGACAGQFDLAQALDEGLGAGKKAAADSGYKSRKPAAPKVASVPVSGDMRTLWRLPTPAGRPHKGKAFVDVHNDVTTKDLQLALREGYDNIEHVKRYTTTGMGTDQGKVSNTTAIGLIAEEQNKTVPQVGITTYRQPYTPVTFGAMTGMKRDSLYEPERTTPMHSWHVANGAVFEVVGQWQRAYCYPKPGETLEQAVQRECKATRESVGVLDGSTLGKIDIRGRDAAEFLNRIYTNPWKKLKPGRARYGLMLGEDGMIMDDGVTARLSEDHFHMTTTTGGAAQVLSWLERWHQTEWPELDVFFNSVTEQWAVITVGGPKARDVMRQLTDDIDLSPEALPFMSFIEGTIAGVKGRLFRISFSGESSFEINVPAAYGLHVWEKVFEAGAPYNITPYGTEGMHLLRAEKGFIIVGQETDGTVTPHDLGMGWAVSSKKDFLGKRSLSCAALAAPDRKQLVGLKPLNPKIKLEEGAHIIENKHLPAPPVPMLGHVTSSYFSPELGRTFALALVKSGEKRKGETLYVPMDGQTIAVEVCDTVFVDKKGKRFNA